MHFFNVQYLNHQNPEGFRLPMGHERMTLPSRELVYHRFSELLKKMPEKENDNNFEKFKKIS